MKIVTTEQFVEHPLEKVFDIEENTTIAEYKAIVPSEIVIMSNYDNKDNEIESKLEEIYSAAMATVEEITDQINVVEGRHKARMGEVSATMLTVALGAVREKSALKMHKDKSAIAGANIGTPNSVTNNLNIVADRNELLRMMLDKSK